MRPHLACDAVESKLKFPLLAMPKFDGVRAININGKLLGRSLKPHGNVFTTKLFSRDEFTGFDGEMINAEYGATHPDLCRHTTSAISTQGGAPNLLWCLFDWLGPKTHLLPYQKRYGMLNEYLPRLRNHMDRTLRVAADRIVVISATLVNNLEQMRAYEEQWLAEGYEGIILRNPMGYHKNGRSTANEGGYLRIKRFVEEEAIVVAVIEGRKNLNPAQINELGQQYRTSHQANMVPNGMVGSFECQDCKTGEPITVAAGKLSAAERLFFFENQSEIKGKTIKYRKFLIGQKDKPRFPTFQSIRTDSDIGAAA